ncbi:BA75_01047T0 [Komagataella pastoris]|uniref:BA75_01047T0 n=1 Tax=Komagataella pastoris TaxID=4922 RepID=A0A1B2J5Z9_PICPA|nr:BA75_01047T0 [Komagataella pastoris]
MLTNDLKRRINDLKYRIGFSKCRIDLELGAALQQFDFLVASNKEITTFLFNSSLLQIHKIEILNRLELQHDSSLEKFLGLEFDRLEEFISRWEKIWQLQVFLDNLYLNQYQFQQLIDSNRKTEYNQVKEIHLNYRKMIERSLRLLKAQISQSLRLNEHLQSKIYKLRSFGYRMEGIETRLKYTCKPF